MRRTPSEMIAGVVGNPTRDPINRQAFRVMLPCRSWLSQPTPDLESAPENPELIRREARDNANRAENLLQQARKLEFKISVKKTENLILANEVKCGLERIASLEREIARLTADNRALRDLLGL